MSEWKEYTLVDVCEKKGEYGLNAPACDFSPNLPTYLRITDISESGRFLEEGKKSVDHPEAMKYILRKDDLVFARTGNSTGKTYLYHPKDGVLVFAGFLIRFSPDQTKVAPRFLKAITETPQYWSWIEANSMRTGQPGINGNEYGKIQFFAPPLPHQRKIARILTTVDNILEKTEAAIAKYKAIKQGMMHDLFTRGIDVKTGKLRPKFENAPELYKESELGWIPKE